MSRRAWSPRHLKPETREWWSRVVRDYELEPHHLRLLTLAAASWDRAEQARVVIEAEGLTFTDKWGSPRAHPAVAIEHQSRIAFARLLRELNLDVGDPDAARPPALKY